jgi:NodT family efflux transporter outer membrane factor (OMF) lipoprotein
MRNHSVPRRAPPRRRPAVAGAFSALSVLSALSGCAVGPKYARPQVDLPSTWQERGDPRVVTQTSADSTWWRVFNDPTLDRLIQQAYHQSLPLQVAGLRILASRAQLGIAVGRQYPQFQAVFASATAVRLSERAINVATLDPAFQNFGDYQIGFDAVWEMDFWRKYRKDVKAGAASYLASVADYDNALVSLTAEVARTYTAIRTFEVLIDQARENVEIQEEGLRIAESRYRHGATSELDVTQASALLESTRGSIPQLQLSLEQTQNALSTLLGQRPGTLQAVLEAPKEIPTVPASVAVGVPAELLRRRPDIRSAELNAVAQCERVGIAVADLYPRFTLRGLFGTQTSSGAGPGTGGSLFDGSAFFYQIGAGLLYPIFNYGRIKNNVRVQDAGFQQALVNYQQTVLKASQEVEDGLAGFLRSQEAAVFAANALRGAQRSVALAMVQYREGAVDYQRVLDAQRSLLLQENTLTQTRSSVATSLIALYKALGGGWELRRGQPFVPDRTVTEMRNRTDWGDLFARPPAENTVNQAENTVNQVSAPPR